MGHTSSRKNYRKRVKKKVHRPSESPRLSHSNLDHFRKLNIRIMSALAGAVLVAIFIILLFVQIIIPAMTQEKVVQTSYGKQYTVKESIEKGMKKIEDK